jgi:hypothetical protein
MNHEEMKNVDRIVMSKEIESVIKKLSTKKKLLTKKSPGLIVFMGKFIKHLKENQCQSFCMSHPKVEDGGEKGRRLVLPSYQSQIRTLREKKSRSQYSR